MSYITMPAAEVRHVAEETLTYLKENRARLLREYCELRRRSFWGRVAAFVRGGKPWMDEEIVAAQTDCMFSATYFISIDGWGMERTARRLLTLAEHSETVHVSGKDLEDLTP